MALVGDSHAAMWNPAFQQIADATALAAGDAGQDGLPIDRRAPHQPPLQSPGRTLSTLRAMARSDHRPVTRRAPAAGRGEHVAGIRGGNENSWLSGFTPYDPAWINSLTRLVQQLRGIGAQVLVLGPIPDPHTSVPLCLSSHLDDVTACSPPRSTAVNQPGIAAEIRRDQSRRRTIHRPHRAVLHRKPLPRHRRQHPGLL